MSPDVAIRCYKGFCRSHLCCARFRTARNKNVMEVCASFPSVPIAPVAIVFMGAGWPQFEQKHTFQRPVAMLERQNRDNEDVLSIDIHRSIDAFLIILVRSQFAADKVWLLLQLLLLARHLCTDPHGQSIASRPASRYSEQHAAAYWGQSTVDGRVRGSASAL